MTFGQLSKISPMARKTLRDGMPVTRRIRKPKTRVAARLQLQNRHREVKAVEIEVVVVNKVVPNVLMDGGSGHQFIVPRAQQKAMDWTDHKVV